MPGRRLNDTERRLLDFWTNPPRNFHRPILRQIRIEGGPGLRGIHRLVVRCPYPFTAICGKNGVGKSTTLALAALSGRRPEDWRVFWGNTRPRRRPEARAGYAFADFFHRAHADAPLDGLRLGWVLVNRGNEIEHSQEYARTRWVRVADPGRLPVALRELTREVDFIPMSRVLASGEFGAMRSAFSGAVPPQVVPLAPEYLAKLSYILGRPYDAGEVRFIRGLGLPACRSGGSYSGFDMGGGECSVIALLSRLQSMPVGGLVVIEEIELGLHAEAQARLVEILLDICLERKIQIVCTTHSEVVLDHLPRQARVLLIRAGAEHEAVNNVSTRFAVHEMSGAAQPELAVYTEDDFASVLVDEALSGPYRARIQIRAVGSNVTLARQSVAHLRANPRLRALSVFDGDCPAAMVERWLRDERAAGEGPDPAWEILPGEGLTPERWLLREISTPAYLEELARALNCTAGDAGRHIEAMRVQPDEHDSTHVLAQRTGLDPIDARRRLVRCVVRRHPQLEPLRARIRAMLD